MPGKKAQLLQSMPRVKVFRLNDERGWEDFGVGHVTIDHLEGSMEAVLVVIDTGDDDTMLLQRITSDVIYRKQEDTFISWCDPEAGMQLSLSFQDAAGCSLIWDTICEMQRKQRPGPGGDSDRTDGKFKEFLVQ